MQLDIHAEKVGNIDGAQTDGDRRNGSAAEVLGGRASVKEGQGERHEC